MEPLFDIPYLLIATLLGLYLLIVGTGVQRLWGMMALVLALGDSFHLLPRIAAAFSGQRETYRSALGRGKLLTSISMTLFYVLLWQAGLWVFSCSLPLQTALLYVLAASRIALCLLPQNAWTAENPSYRFALYRNLPFTLQGGLVLWLFARYGGGTGLQYMWLAIFLSFAFYLPVVLFAHRYPKLGMLMLPKSCAYVWIIAMGLAL